MRAKVTVILDDRLAPSPEVAVAIGSTPFSGIRRRRRRLLDETGEAASSVGAAFCVIKTDLEAESLAKKIENRGSGPLYLRIPAFITPMNFSALPRVIDKASYALETTFVAPISVDDAPMILTSHDAPRVLRAQVPEDRRALLLQLSETAPRMVDHLQTTDLRLPHSLLYFLSGITEARHFNQTEAHNGIFSKSSDNVAKMKAEYSYFHVVPERMKRYLIPTFDYWEENGRAGYSMEHLLMPDVSIQLIHGAFAPDDFESLLDHFFSFIATREEGPIDHNSTFEAGRSHIVGKLDARLLQLMEMDAGKKLDSILKACGPLGSLDEMRNAANRIIVSELEKTNSARLVVGHGDPCFSNIIFDRRLGLMRFIDPRGATRLEDAWMHPLYDLAKFSHSILGGYDYINNGLYRCQLDDKLTLELCLDSGGAPDWAKAAFLERLKIAGYDIRAVRAVELSLFMSMLPLHANDPQKLAGFALTAASILVELEK